MCLMCGVEWVRECEPSAERFIIGRVNVDIVCFERCGKKLLNEHSCLCGTTEMLTGKIVFLWHVILRKEWDLEVVHKDESGYHTTS